MPDVLKGNDADSAKRPEKKPTDVFGSTESPEDVRSLFSKTTRPDETEGPQYGYSKIRLHKNEEVSPYAATVDARYAMDPRKRAIVLLSVGVFVFFIIAVFLPDQVFSINNLNISLAWWIEGFKENVENLTALITLQAYSGGIEFKVCQYIICLMAGAALGISGALYQGTLKNAMASPSTLGVMSGASLGSIIYILFFYSGGAITTTVISMEEFSSQYAGMNIFQYILATQMQALFTLAGSTIIVMLVLLIARVAGRGKVSKVALIIAGQVFTATIMGIISLIRYWLTYRGDTAQLEAVQSIATGTLSVTFTWLDVVLVAIPVSLGIFIIMRLRSRFNLLAFDDEEARSMGISTTGTRNLVIGICTILTAVVVAFCGTVGFVGFLVPHLARKLVGPDFKYLVPATALLGAALVMVANFLTNQCLNGMGMGSITGIVGALVFLVAVIRQRGRGNADWV